MQSMSNNCVSQSRPDSLLNLVTPNERIHQDQRPLDDTVVPRWQPDTNTREHRIQHIHRIIDEALALIDEDIDTIFGSEDESDHRQ